MPTTRSGRRPRGQRREVDRQHVGLDDLELAARLRSRAARSRSSSITVSRPQRSTSGSRQRAQAGADLDQRLARLRVDRARRCASMTARVGQEVLAEALARRCALTAVHCGGSRNST